MNPCGGARGETWWLTGSRREVAVCSGRRGASGIDGDRRWRPEEGEEDGGGVEASQLVPFGVVDVVDGGEPFGHVGGAIGARWPRDRASRRRALGQARSGSDRESEGENWG